MRKHSTRAKIAPNRRTMMNLLAGVERRYRKFHRVATSIIPRVLQANHAKVNSVLIFGVESAT
jgi:hypothetical protein